MIHVFIGTKAQYVKTAPVLKELDRRGVRYNLIDSGQHSAISKHYRKYFKIKEPDMYLRQSEKDITTVFQLFVWIMNFLFKTIFRPKKIFSEIFRGEGGICLVHGDTPTTLLSLLAAKRSGIKVAHLESGLRSYNLFHPFPEELIRIITMRFADYLFAPSRWAYDNLKQMRISGSLFQVRGNTNIDALGFVLERKIEQAKEILVGKKYVIFSIHRVETILNRRRLYKIVTLVKNISEKTSVIFCVHPSTRKRLANYGFDKMLSNLPNVIVRDLLPHPQFIHAMKSAYFIVTDGGSIQEESYFLNIPCLLMRNRTERMEGVGQNVCISEFDDAKIDYFLNNIEKFRVSDYRDEGISPSEGIVDIILNKLI